MTYGCDVNDVSHTPAETAHNRTPCMVFRRGGRKAFPMFQMIACNIACLAIATLYYTWRDVYKHRRQREKLNERVAYMLWMAASRAA